MSKTPDHESAAALAIARGDVNKVNKQDLIEHAMSLGRMAGRIETADMFAKYGDVSALLWLQQVKETKAYKMVGTWAEFCKYVGLGRSQVDEDLSNINEFGEAFLLTVGNLGLGYRDIRKLRQISHDGGVKVEDGMVLIAGEEIPLDADHAEDLQNTLARIIDDAHSEARTHERLAKEKGTQSKSLIRKLDQHERKAEQRGIPEDESAFADYMEELRIGFEGYMLTCSVAAMEEEAEEMTPGKRAKLLSTAKNMRDAGDLLYQQAVDKYGQGLTEKGNIWRPGKK